MGLRGRLRHPLLQSLWCYSAVSFGLWLKDKNISWSERSSLSLIINTLIIKAAPPWKHSMARSKRDSVCLVSSGVAMDTGLEVQLIKPKCHFSLVIKQNDSLGCDNTSTDTTEENMKAGRIKPLKSVCRGIKVFMVPLNVSRSGISWWNLLFRQWKHTPVCYLWGETAGCS